MIVSAIRQGSDAWREARCGVVTASNFKAILTRGGGKTRSAYMRRLIEEIITGRVAESSFHSEAMSRGVDLEPRARRAYESLTGHSVREIGLAWLDDARRVAASPDGLIGEEGGLEIKCPLPHTHEKYLSGGCVPTAYLPQVQGNLWVTGRKWWDFVSFAPEFGEKKRVMLCRVHRDEAYIATLRAEVLRFVEELDRLAARQKGRWRGEGY